MFESIKNNSAKSRIIEEQLYEQVANELDQGAVRKGLWAKALAHSGGSEQTTKALYMKYRVQSIKDELRVTVEIKKQQDKKSTKIGCVEESKNENTDSLSNILTFLGLGVIIFMIWVILSSW